MLFVIPFAAVQGQPTPAPVAHTNVTVKPNADNLPFAVMNVPPGPLTLRGVTLKKLVMDAYGVPGFQVMGGPSWISAERWDFRLQVEPVIMPTDQYRKVLLKSLEECFQLRAHRETKVLPIYELTVASKGPNLRDDPWLDARGPLIKDEVGSIQLRNSSLEEFAHRLSLHLGRPVLDRIGTTGLFRISLNWMPEPGEDGGPDAAGLPPGTPTPIPNTGGQPILQAIQSQLGLRLIPGRGPVEVIVIEKAENRDRKVALPLSENGASCQPPRVGAVPSWH